MKVSSAGETDNCKESLLNCKESLLNKETYCSFGLCHSKRQHQIQPSRCANHKVLNRGYILDNGYLNIDVRTAIQGLMS